MAEQSFLRRLVFLIAAVCVLAFILVGRMYYLQIFEGQHFRSLAEGNRIALQPIVSLRGEVYDRNGVSLALNKATFRVSLIKDRNSDVEQALEMLERYIHFTPEEKEKVLTKSKKKQGLEPLILKDHLTWKEVSLLELNQEDLPGLFVEVGHMRYYPREELAAHLLGYVSAPSEKEQEEDPVLTIPDLPVGKVGIEKQLDVDLRGIPGHKQLEVNAGRKVVREISHFPAKPGKTLKLTIDARLQEYISECLTEHESGSVVVMDVHNGDVLALVSHPTFDPNLFVDGISHVNWRSLMDNPYVPLTNKAVAGTYAPGSTLKMLAVLAALESGVVNENTTVFCPGHMYVGNHKFHCWRKGGHGPVNAKKAIVQSCDVYFYEVAKKLGIERLNNMFMTFGLGEKHLIKFPHEKYGLIPTREMKKAKTGYNWTVTDTILTIIGQGYMLATPMQLAVMASRLATGKEVQPRLVRSDEDVDFSSIGIQPDNLHLVQQAMGDVVNRPGGTAYRHHLDGAEYAGKTGTSQVRRISMAERQQNLTRTDHLDWKYREHGLFVAYYPLEEPRYAISVVLEHVGGSSKAAKVAHDILEYIREMEAADA